MSASVTPRCPEKLTKDVFGLSATCSPAVLLAGAGEAGHSVDEELKTRSVDGLNRTEIHRDELISLVIILYSCYVFSE